MSTKDLSVYELQQLLEPIRK